MTKKCVCGKHQPRFKLSEDKSPIWCSECKPANAINCVDKKCECGSGKKAIYGLVGDKKPKWCINCRPSNSVNINNKKCIECNKIPNFNYEGETIGIYCIDHKLDNMIDVKHIKCKCGKRATLGLVDENIPKWCSNCREKDAVNVAATKCECGKHQPSLGIIGEKPIWCKDCPNKSPDAINLTNKKCECGKHQPVFNVSGENVAKWCKECPNKPLNAINIKIPKCKECNLTSANPKYKGYCSRCFINLFPDEPNAKNYKIKEKHVFDAVLKLLPDELEISRDKHVNGCSKRRPDLMIDCGSHWICAENDENCHKDYDTTCENKRTMELYTDMGNRPMILIRFNCDKYSGGGSLFKICRKTGISLIKSQKEFKERISKFAELINQYIESEPPEKAITTEYLYYD